MAGRVTLRSGATTPGPGCPTLARGKAMKKTRERGISRREFVKLTGAGALAAGVGPAFLFPRPAGAASKTLKILQWSHFIPAYDKWFDGVFTKEWGQKHDTEVTVDHITIAEINARAAAEVSAQKGHDLFMSLSPPAPYHHQPTDPPQTYHQLDKHTGKPTPLSTN